MTIRNEDRQSKINVNIKVIAAEIVAANVGIGFMIMAAANFLYQRPEFKSSVVVSLKI